MVTSIEEYMGLTEAAKAAEDPVHVLELLHSEDVAKAKWVAEKNKEKNEAFDEESESWTEDQKLEYMTGEIK